MGMTIRRKLSCYVPIIAALACSLSVFAKPNPKDKDKDKENNSEIKFTARTELVLIPALVTDKSGNHITGLKQEDFTVLETAPSKRSPRSRKSPATRTVGCDPEIRMNLAMPSRAGRPTGALRLWCSISLTRPLWRRRMPARICSSI
jgi:hypothetical protein